LCGAKVGHSLRCPACAKQCYICLGQGHTSFACPLVPPEKR
jgi:hypothetical protein